MCLCICETVREREKEKKKNRVSVCGASLVVGGSPDPCLRVCGRSYASRRAREGVEIIWRSFTDLDSCPGLRCPLRGGVLNVLLVGMRQYLQACAQYVSNSCN